MSNLTQSFKLFEVLKSGQTVAVDKIAQELDIKLNSVPVYIHALKKKGANIVSVREERKVVGYQLLNASDLNISQVRKNSSTVKVSSPKTTPSKPEITDEAEKLAEISGDVSERELLDLRSQYLDEREYNLAETIAD